MVVAWGRPREKHMFQDNIAGKTGEHGGSYFVFVLGGWLSSANFQRHPERPGNCPSWTVNFERPELGQIIELYHV